MASFFTGLLDKITEEINKRKPKFDVMDVLSDTADPEVKRQIEKFNRSTCFLKNQRSPLEKDSYAI